MRTKKVITRVLGALAALGAIAAVCATVVTLSGCEDCAEIGEYCTDLDCCEGTCEFDQTAGYRCR